MGRRKQAKTMEVIEERLPEEQPESESEVERKAEAAAEAAVEAMEILAKIEDATRNVDEAALMVERVKRELKYRKEMYEDHVERLKNLCRTRLERHPLLDGEPERDGGSGGDGEGAGEPADRDAWKELPLSALGLTPGLVSALEDADITTIGRLADEMSGDPLSWHDDIRGVGAAAVQMIAEKFAEFWREHPEWDDDEDDGEIEEDGEVDEDEDE